MGPASGRVLRHELGVSAHAEPSAWANPIFMIAYRLPLLNVPVCEECGGPCDTDEDEGVVVTYASKN